MRSENIQQLIDGSQSERTNSGICTGWILLTEWVDESGNVWLEENRTADIPAWKRLGILNYVATIEEEEYE